jgi:uncharacterized protein YneF (UPF0154 family)
MIYKAFILIDQLTERMEIAVQDPGNHPPFIEHSPLVTYCAEKVAKKINKLATGLFCFPTTGYMKQLAPFLVMIVVLIILAVLISGYFHYRLRKRILDAGPLDDEAIRLLRQVPGVASEALKWGLLLFFGGIGLIVLAFIPYNFEGSPLPYGLEAVFLSVGFLLYYGISWRRKS